MNKQNKQQDDRNLQIAGEVVKGLAVSGIFVALGYLALKTTKNVYKQWSRDIDRLDPDYEEKHSSIKR